MDLEQIKKRVARFIIEYGILLVILAVGLAIWVPIFNLSLEGYLSEDLWINWDVWLGNDPGHFEIFGYTINYQFEGYTDYPYFYVHWGNNMLSGLMPYSDEFGHIVLDGYENNNGLYIFPPLTAVFYGLGTWILPDNWGIGFLIAALGFLTALPVYGLGKEFSGNRHVGEVAAFTYLLAPNVLFHIDYLWLNPSPMIFFFFSGYYMLVRGKRHTGTLLIVTAALFKQTAWFLGIPLVVYLLMKSRTPEPTTSAEDTSQDVSTEVDSDQESVKVSDQEGKLGRLQNLTNLMTEYLDLRKFIVSVLVVLVFVAAVMFPFVVAQPNFWSYMRLAAGGFRLESFTEPPGYGSPMRLQVLPVIAGLPELARIMNFIVYSGGLMYFGVIVFAALMLVEPKLEGQSKVYLRRLLFLTLLMMLWVNIAGPRGVYKYYFTLFAPFFSIFSSSTIATSMEQRVPFSFSMIWVPFLLSAMILIPHRNIYLVYVIVIFGGYIASKKLGETWYYAKTPFRKVNRRISSALNPFSIRISKFRERMHSYAYPDESLNTQSKEQDVEGDTATRG